MIALSPIIIHHNHPSESIENPNTRILVIIGCIIVFSAILMIPGIITQANKGILNLFVDGTAAKEVYTDQVDEVSDSGGAIRNLPAVVYNSLHLLMSYTGRSRDVMDPWYTGDFEQAFQDILEGCEAMLRAGI